MKLFLEGTETRLQAGDLAAVEFIGQIGYLNFYRGSTLISMVREIGDALHNIPKIELPNKESAEDVVDLVASAAKLKATIVQSSGTWKWQFDNR